MTWLHYLLRDEVTSIHSISGPKILGNRLENSGEVSIEEDLLSYVALRRNNVTFHLHDSFLIPHNLTKLEIYGTAGTLTAIHCFTSDNQSELYLWRHGHQQSIAIEPISSYQKSIEMFTGAIRGHARPLATGTDGLRSLNVALSAEISLRRRHRVNIPPLPSPDVDHSIF